MSEMTTEMRIDQLEAGDVVTAVNGAPRPFPFTVKRVLNFDVTVKGRRYVTTRVDFEHGGLILPTDPAFVTATVVRG